MPRLDAARVGAWRGAQAIVNQIERGIDDELRADWDIPLGWYDVLASLATARRSGPAARRGERHAPAAVEPESTVRPAGGGGLDRPSSARRRGRPARGRGRADAHRAAAVARDDRQLSARRAGALLRAPRRERRDRPAAGASTSSWPRATTSSRSTDRAVAWSRARLLDRHLGRVRHPVRIRPVEKWHHRAAQHDVDAAGTATDRRAAQGEPQVSVRHLWGGGEVDDGPGRGSAASAALSRGHDGDRAALRLTTDRHDVVPRPVDNMGETTRLSFGFSHRPRADGTPVRELASC